MTADPSLEPIKRFLAAQPDIRLGMVFGSVTHDRARTDSDLDIALLGDHALASERRAELIAALARLYGRPVDLIDLKTAGIPIARSAVLDGQVLYSRNSGDYPAQVTRLLIDSADFLPYRDRLLKERRDAWIG
ncbi:DNA polymerase subunit beta [Salinisphaera orenii MK-B5]|uniref:DNA polymerase subunit beta n=1 Tax=Salinisphaera orenii MK-B5 TaxID=856730 RepID=A0A423PLA2_9GAMM|nr:nucleotidyltransferase domain-containing protein [Salinisphaera orenii]ROO26377.1 DNA polymerase subunit beta [Salinisphaera orenii MK-B5]